MWDEWVRVDVEWGWGKSGHGVRVGCVGVGRVGVG